MRGRASPSRTRSACRVYELLARPPRRLRPRSTTTSASAPACSGSMRRRLAVRRTRCTTRSPSTATSTSRTRPAPWRRAHAAPLVRLPRHADEGRAPAAAPSSPCRRTRSKDIVAQMGVARRHAAHRAGRRRPGAASARCPHVARVPGRLMTTASADVPLKGLAVSARGAGQGAHRARRRAPRRHRPAAGTRARSPRSIERLGLTDAVEFVTGVTDERIVELYAEAEIAVVPSLYEGFSLPAIEAMACGVPLVTTTGGALPEVVGPPARPRMLVPPGRPRRARRAARRRARTTPSCAPASATAAGAACSTASPGARPPTAPPSTTTSSSKRTRGGARRRASLMLTVDFDRLGLARRRAPPRPGLRRRSARVRGDAPRRDASSRSTTPRPTSRTSRAVAGAMLDAGEIADDALGGRGQRRRAATCRSPTTPSTASSCPRCSSTSGTTSARSPSSCACCAPAAASR